MRVVFPCKGVIVLTKEDMQKLGSFYQTKLMTSKMYEYYKTSDVSLQIGNFDYFPKKYSFVLKDANLLSIKQLRSILDMNVPQKNATTAQNTPTKTPEVEEKISDASISSHPFFQTLKTIN